MNGKTMIGSTVLALKEGSLTLTEKYTVRDKADEGSYYCVRQSDNKLRQIPASDIKYVLPDTPGETFVNG